MQCAVRPQPQERQILQSLQNSTWAQSVALLPVPSLWVLPRARCSGSLGAALLAFGFWLRPFTINVTWGKSKRRDVITKCHSNDTFLIALFINIYWCLELTNTWVHPQWVPTVNLKDLSFLWSRADDPAQSSYHSAGSTDMNTISQVPRFTPVPKAWGCPSLSDVEMLMATIMLGDWALGSDWIIWMKSSCQWN